jgi:hypothetical protein
MTTYTCPLCNQPVSSSLYIKITGIWKVRERDMAKIKAERAELKKKEAQFKLQKAKLVKDTANKITKQYQAKFNLLKQNEGKIKADANKKVAKAIRKAHSEAERKAELKGKAAMTKLEKKMTTAMKKQAKVAQVEAKAEAKLKFKGIERALKANVMAFKAESKKLHSQNTKQEAQIDRLQKQLEDQASPQVEGFIFEKELMAELQKKFPDDKFVNTGKGGDVIQSVIVDRQVIGTIVYECKKVKNWSAKHVKQTWDAQRKRKAEFGVLVTNAMKKGTNGFFIERGVLVVHGTAVIYVAGMLRRQIVQLDEMKLGQAQREKAVKNILKYLESPDFTNSVSSIVQDSIILHKGLVDEIKKHFKVWKERNELYSRINLEARAIEGNTKTLLSGKEKEQKKIENFPALPELPDVKEDS